MEPDFESGGKRVRWHDLGEIGVGEVEMPPRLSLSGHAHDSAQICFVLEGRYREEWAGRELELKPGSTLFRPPGVAHANEFDGDDPVVALLVSFSPDRFEGLRGCEPARFSENWSALLREEMERELELDDALSTTVLEALAILLSARISRQAGSRREAAPVWLSEAIAYIDRSYASPIGLSDVAGQVGMSRSTLAAGFRRWLSSSVGAEIRKRRVREAVRRLTRTEDPIALVALESGFCDQAHLTRHVVAATGLTPSVLRRRMF